MGLDPGIRTGVKVAVVDQTGKVRRHLDHLPARAEARLERLARHARRAVPQAQGRPRSAIGNGTASRETDKLAAELMAKSLPELEA